ncbi:hypothetical protein PanWU01x14_270010 [Parasponia andersonii]|uniref:Uncharacterized protein n=1 Tax=Parasponia andersonii TaxID=3476 RepID=A0A2P5B5K5_PARAD|nr:hypothetical protein PanWU01x14_270010 [Parasponia andersonii]
MTKYLGFPLFITCRKKEDFQFVLDYLESRLASWKRKLFSKARRLILINQVGQSIASYAMQTVALSMATCNKIDSLFRRFWWGSNNKGNSKLCLKTWDSICSPKSVGSLGIRRTVDINCDLIGKWG